MTNKVDGFLPPSGTGELAGGTPGNRLMRYTDPV